MSPLQQFFNGKNSVRGATGLLIITLTLSNILGLFRDRFLAAKIPADQLDAYYAAFRLPDFLTNLIVIGAIAVIFIPVFTELKAQSEKDAWAAASAILNMMLVVLVVGALFLIIGMPYLMPLVVPDFPAEKLELTIRLARWLSLTPILFGISYIFSGLLNSFQRFTVYSLAPLVYNGSIIIATVLFADRYGVIGVTLGVLAGAFLHMLIQLPVALSLGWQWQGILTVHHPAVRKVGRLMLPRMVALGMIQFVSVVITAIASGWAGAITYYTLATNIQTMPTAVFANSIATAIFPTIAEAAARNDNETFKKHLVQGIRWIIFLLIPATAGLITIRIQVVRLILGAGFFGWEATQTTADVLGWLATSIVALGLIPLLARAFYARQDMQTPMHIALISGFVTIVLSIVLPRILPATVSPSSGYLLHVGEVAALAIAYSVGSIVNAWLLFVAVRRVFQVSFAEVTASVVKIIAATLLMIVTVQLAKTLVGTYVNLDFGFGILLQTAIPLVIGVVTYAAAVWLMGCPEWHELSSFLKRKTNSTATSTNPA